MDLRPVYAAWSSPAYPPDIRQLRDLMRYRVKLTNMLTGEEPRQNCLTVSNLKLDDVFSTCLEILTPIIRFWSILVGL
ncbi:MAG: hypothetical protein ACLS63_08515 [Flavonifractor plautii]